MRFLSDLGHDNTTDDENIDKDTPNEEQFNIQLSDTEDKYILINTRIDYQYRSNVLDKLCLYDFVSMLYKKKMNTGDKKYLSQAVEPTEEETGSRRGRPSNKRYLFQKEHPQATMYLMMEHSEPQIPVLFGPQIPRKDREDTRERYCRALLTLFVPWRTVHDLSDINQTWEEAFTSRQSRIASHSWKIIENIQLLHECKNDRDEHLLQVIAEAQTEKDQVDPELLPENSNSHEEYDPEDAVDLLDLLGQLDERTLLAVAAKDSSENRYIQETIQAVESVGRFTERISECWAKLILTEKCTDCSILAENSSVRNLINLNKAKEIIPFVPMNAELVRLNASWKQQLKNERDRVRRSLITGNHAQDDDVSIFDAVKDATVAVIDSRVTQFDDVDRFDTVPPLVSVTTKFPSQQTIAEEFTLNREQRAAFMIITSHLDGDARCRSGESFFYEERINIDYNSLLR